MSTTKTNEMANKRQKLIDESGYDVLDGTIISPGKFEGEQVYALHYWNLVLDGGADSTVYDGDSPIDLFTISDEDKAIFPELEGYTSVSLTTSEQGFVYCRTHEEPIAKLEELFANDTPSEPQPEDYTIADNTRGGYDVGIVEGKFIGNFKTYSEAQLAVRADMDASQFWPNVWTISDHGNCELVQLTV